MAATAATDMEASLCNNERKRRGDTYQNEGRRLSRFQAALRSIAAPWLPASASPPGVRGVGRASSVSGLRCRCLSLDVSLQRPGWVGFDLLLVAVVEVIIEEPAGE